MNENEIFFPQSMSHLLHEERTFAPPTALQNRAEISSIAQYQALYHDSIQDSEKFWLNQAESLDWIKKPTRACRYLWDSANNHIEHTWFEDGVLNLSINCLDRHSQKDKIAFLWQGDNESETATITYGELLAQVNRFANVLKTHGIHKGDRVCLYMPLVIELPVVLLACARIGAIHTVVFGGFSAESLAHRIQDSSCKLLVTGNEALRGGKIIPLKEIADVAVQECPTIEKVIVYQRTSQPCSMQPGRDLWFHEEMGKQSDQCAPEPLNAEDPLFILYTSGSTGKPKGVVHTQAGYLLQAAMTHRLYFDLKPDDIYWCTADIGWVTGHSYVVYGPLTNGATILLFEGSPLWPDPGRYWQIIDKYKVTLFYTAPTAIRALISKGNSFPEQYKLNSLRLLATVGEPINPEAWMWYRNVIGKEQCPVVDTWWQTETGGILIAPLPGCAHTKPGSAWRPFFGVRPSILRDNGTPCDTNEGGCLCIDQPWPGIMRTTWGDHQRFIDTYFKHFPGRYFTGDGARCDSDGDYWLMGRVDDVVNISGHRVGTAEVESALVSHPSVAEAAVVPIPNEIRGQGLAAFIILKEGSDPSKLKENLVAHVRKEIGAIAVPDQFIFVSALSKTRSGKIMRRILRKIAEGEKDNLGDISTLADPSVINDIIKLVDLNN